MSKKEMDDRDRQRYQLAKQVLEQRGAMIRMQLDEVSWVAYKLGASLTTAEKLVAAVKEGREDWNR
jgi:uncharacterized protein YbcI